MTRQRWEWEPHQQAVFRKGRFLELLNLRNPCGNQNSQKSRNFKFQTSEFTIPNFRIQKGFLGSIFAPAQITQKCIASSSTPSEQGWHACFTVHAPHLMDWVFPMHLRSSMSQGFISVSGVLWMSGMTHWGIQQQIKKTRLWHHPEVQVTICA